MPINDTLNAFVEHGRIEVQTRQDGPLAGLSFAVKDFYDIAVGNPADLVVLDCETKAEAVCEIAQPLFGFKNGIRTFIRPAASLLKPH